MRKEKENKRCRSQVITPFVVRDGKLCRGRFPVNEPTVLIMMDKFGLYSVKIGDRGHIERSYARYVESDRRFSRCMVCFTFGKDFPLEIVRALFNAHVNDIACGNMYAAILKERPDALEKQFYVLKEAGY